MLLIILISFMFYGINLIEKSLTDKVNNRIETDYRKSVRKVG